MMESSWPRRFTARAGLIRERFLMSKAVVDPGEVRRFAHQLKQFTGELLNQMAVVQRQVSGLGATWRDQEHKKFLEDFEQQIQVLRRFVESTNQYVPYLIRKAERVEEYLHQR
jgi:uncharacterized protein YukE